MNSLEPSSVCALLLAAGHGTRMRPLTDSTPKPLLKVGGQRLIEYHINKLSALGIKRIIINTAYLSDQFPEALGDGSNYDVELLYSDESQTGALETAGGIVNALPLINTDWFLTINADVWTDADFSKLLSSPPSHARLILVDNPEHNMDGDFALKSTGKLSNDDEARLTFSGISVFHRRCFESLRPGKRALGPLLRDLINENLIEGEKLNSQWFDIGTPERLKDLDKKLKLN